MKKSKKLLAVICVVALLAGLAIFPAVFHFAAIEGIDSDWIYIDNKSYLNIKTLDSGRYTLKIRARDGHGNLTKETNINIKLRDTALNILGQNMHITKLDIQSGVLEVDGIIDSIKYGKTGNWADHARL